MSACLSTCQVFFHYWISQPFLVWNWNKVSTKNGHILEKGEKSQSGFYAKRSYFLKEQIFVIMPFSFLHKALSMTLKWIIHIYLNNLCLFVIRSVKSVDKTYDTAKSEDTEQHSYLQTLFVFGDESRDNEII